MSTDLLYEIEAGSQSGITTSDTLDRDDPTKSITQLAARALDLEPQLLVEIYGFGRLDAN